MGTNCAGYLANVYLYAYELQFVRQIAAACTPCNRLSSADSSTQQLTAQKILTAFSFTVRYIDDVHAVNNAYLQYMTYTSQTHLGFHGVYGIHTHHASTSRWKTKPYRSTFST